MKLLILLAFSSLALALRFDGDQVLTLYPKTESHIALLKEFESYENFADFWKPASAENAQIGKPVDVRFKSQNLRVIRKKLAALGFDYEVKIENLQTLIDNQFDMTRRSKALVNYDYNIYHTYEEINAWTKDIAARYPNLATRENLILSDEGREIPKLTLGSSTNNPIILIDCGMHAREWITPAFCQCLVNDLLSNTDMMNSLTWVILPVLNVDGYAYSWTNDRMWRKTRTNYGTVCKGVDPNRNFDANWSGPGASGSPCSETYHGPVVESEQLTKGLSKFIRNNSGKIKAYMTFHSYGQVFLYPYSYDVKDVDNANEHYNLAGAATAALRSVHGKIYDYGAGYDIFYLAAGGSDDMAVDYGVPISYTVELRDEGRYGFLLPENQIQPTCEETLEAVKVIAQHVMG